MTERSTREEAPVTRAASGALKMPRQQSRHEGQGETSPMTTSHTPRTGTLTFVGEYATLAFGRRIPHPVQAGWEALTEPEHLARWNMRRAVIDARAGGSITFGTGPAN